MARFFLVDRGYWAQDCVHRIDRQKKLSSEAQKFLLLEPLLSDMPKLDLDGIDWVVVGGETNKRMKFRPME